MSRAASGCSEPGAAGKLPVGEGSDATETLAASTLVVET
jgi:hypothetical protein